MMGIITVGTLAPVPPAIRQRESLAQPIVLHRCQCNLIAGTGTHADSSLIH